MITRRDVIADAADKCMKELYSLAQPTITWEDFIKENKEFIKREEEYYKLPKEVLKEIVDNYIYAYEIDEHQNLLDTIDLLKKYCDDPIEEFYHPGEGESPGYRDYRHPDNLVTCLISELKEYASSDISEEIVYKAKDLFFKFLDMAGKFYNSHWWLNSFNTTVYLGASPNSNKEAVIENWKKYRNKDIEIDESKYNEEDYD